MGWTSADDTLNQVQLHFDTLEEARAFADRQELRLRGHQAACDQRKAEELCRQFPL